MKLLTSYILLFGILLGGCTKNLELIPKDTISDETFWKTPQDFKLAANNLYTSLDGFNTRDNESDISFSNGNDVSRGTYQPTEVSSEWTQPYVYIRNANKILEMAADFPDRASITA